MRTLLAYELRKILNRKVLWVALALGVAMWVQVRGIAIIHERLTGSAQGEKDVIMRYEGQVLTKTLQARMQKDYESYVAAHADRFIPEPVGEGESDSGRMLPNQAATPYDEGIWVAFSNLIGAWPLEGRQSFVRDAQERLAADTDAQGKPLTDVQRRDYQETVRLGVAVPVVHYVRGWEKFYQIPNENGLWVLLATGMALLGLFNGEASARMESVVLTARARQRAVAAKLLAGATVAGGSVVLFFGLQLAAQAYTWGLQGAMLPVTALNQGYGSMPILAVFALSALVLVLAAMACGAVVAWASAQFRHGLLTLLVGGGILAAMALLLYYEEDLIGRWRSTMDFRTIDRFLYTLPTNPLRDTYFLPDHVADGGMLALLILLPTALTVLLCCLARHAFLRRRRV